MGRALDAHHRCSCGKGSVREGVHWATAPCSVMGATESASTNRRLRTSVYDGSVRSTARVVAVRRDAAAAATTRTTVSLV